MHATFVPYNVCSPGANQTSKGKLNLTSKAFNFKIWKSRHDIFFFVERKLEISSGELRPAGSWTNLYTSVTSFRLLQVETHPSGGGLLYAHHSSIASDYVCMDAAYSGALNSGIAHVNQKRLNSH